MTDTVDNSYGGIRTTCRDNRRLGRQGCGADYGGKQVHCTIPADWSTHPDGLCHETFAAYSTFDRHVRDDGANHQDPRTLDTLKQDDRGVWHVDREGHPWSKANRV